MGTLLTFQPSPRDPRSYAPQAEKGKLLLFTGIRYERASETEEEEKPRRRRVRSRRPT
jgi:hypothetical protein